MSKRPQIVPALVVALQAFPRAAAACAEHASGAIKHPPPAPLANLLHWSRDPLVTAGLAVSAGTYAFGAWRLWRHAGHGHGLRIWQVASFAAGWLTLVVALLSPLDALSDVFFSAHMTQHEVLMLVSAPLIVLGWPWLALLWALPSEPRRRALGWTAAPEVRRVWRACTHPAVALVVHGGVLWVWHVPVLFEAALRDEFVHGVQHATFFFSAALFFWAVIHGRYGRLGYGASAFFVFLTALHSGMLGALLTIAHGLLYPSHAARTERWNGCALEDQQLAGLIMWVPAAVALLVVGLGLFAAWLGEAERRSALENKRAT
jgi:putative membrane protein